MDTQTLISKLTKAITFAFKFDGTSPGLTISWISHNKSYYASIVRWINGEKIVVCSAQNVDLDMCLSILSKTFLEATPVPINPMEELASFLQPNSPDIELQKLFSAQN